MQARLKDLEQQLELAKSASASRASGHSPTSSTASASRQVDASDHRQSNSQAMSAWVKGALGEAGTIARGGAQEPSWLGLGSWVSD